MPILDGYEAARKIRDWEREHHKRRTPVVALTASALGDAVMRANEAGCDAHVTKPVKKSTLLAAIKDAVEASVGETDAVAPPASSKGGAMKEATNAKDPAVPKDREIVQVDADLGDLIPGFLERKRAEAAAIPQAVARHDYDSIKAVAHRIKGEGGSYGFDSITAMGRLLESALAARDDGEIVAVANRLVSYIDRVQIVYLPSDADPSASVLK